MKHLRALLYLLLEARSPNRDLLAADVTVWLTQYAPERIGRRERDNLVYLLARFQEFRNLVIYRCGKRGDWLTRLLVKLARRVGFRPQSTLYISCPDIGPGLFIQHGFATAIGARKIGRNCWINQQVTIGWKGAGKSPVIGDNVRVSCGAKVLGDIEIGNDVVVGPNSLATKNIPAGSTVIGVPGRVFRRPDSRADLAEV